MSNASTISYGIGLDGSPFLNSIRACQAAVSGFRGAIETLGNVGNVITGIKSAFDLLRGGLSVFKEPIMEAADMEDMESTFSTLLGSASKAKDRLAELANFAATTPFELPEVAKASTTLETLTRGALSVGKGLTLVGDVAAVTKQPFADMSVIIGRLYDGLQSGRPVGEMLARLQELGAISGPVRARIEELQATGADGARVWAVAESALSRFSGSMEKKSATFLGLMSNLSDGWKAVQRTLGTPIMQALKPVIAEGATMLAALIPLAQKIGDAIGTSIRMAFAYLKSGEILQSFTDIFNIARLESLDFIQRFVAGFASGVVAITGILATSLGDFFSSAWEAIKNLASATGSFFQSIAMGIKASFIEAFSGIFRDIASSDLTPAWLAKMLNRGADNLDDRSGAARKGEGAAADKANEEWNKLPDASTIILGIADTIQESQTAFGSALADAMKSDSLTPDQRSALDKAHSSINRIYNNVKNAADAGRPKEEKSEWDKLSDAAKKQRTGIFGSEAAAKAAANGTKVDAPKETWDSMSQARRNQLIGSYGSAEAAKAAIKAASSTRPPADPQPPRTSGAQNSLGLTGKETAGFLADLRLKYGSAAVNESSRALRESARSATSSKGDSAADIKRLGTLVGNIASSLPGALAT